MVSDCIEFTFGLVLASGLCALPAQRVSESFWEISNGHIEFQLKVTQFW